MERRYTEKEQRRIFTRALELQREAGVTVTLSELEATALEAGIDPRFLSVAVNEVHLGRSRAKSDLPVLQAIVLGCLCLAQVYTVSGQALNSQREFYVPFVVAVAAGAFFSDRKVIKNFITVGTVVILASALTYGFQLLVAASVSDSFWIYFRNTLLVQILMFLLGSALVGWVRSRLGANLGPTSLHGVETVPSLVTPSSVQDSEAPLRLNT